MEITSFNWKPVRQVLRGIWGGGQQQLSRLLPNELTISTCVRPVV